MRRSKGPKHALRRLAWTAVLPAALLATAVRADDRDLLRFDAAKPYVFVIFDTSASMNETTGSDWVEAGGDDRRSKLHQAKKAMYEVFGEVDDVQFGFASLNQDALRVRGKHWLYYTNDTRPSTFPLPYPDPQPPSQPIEVPVCENASGQPVACGVAGSRVVDLAVNYQGDVLTFGPHLGVAPVGEAGTCSAGLPLGAPGSAQRARFNRFAKLGFPGSGDETKIWVDTGGNAESEYVLTFRRVSGGGDLGGAEIQVELEARAVIHCSPNSVSANPSRMTLTFVKHTEFLMWDTVAGNEPGADGEGGAPWSWQDALQDADCGSAHPFSGFGWEGNYDGTFNGSPGFTPESGNEDPYAACASRYNPLACENLKRATTVHPIGRALDVGDVLPLDWDREQQAELLSRLAPLDPGPSFDYGVAKYFDDVPDPATGFLPLKNTAHRPLVGAGLTPLGKAVADFRCFYLGDGNKCKDSIYDDDGWEALASTRDAEWGCRKPYLIVISDGKDNCPGENPCADTANLNTKGLVQTWVVAYGANCNQVGNPMKCMATNGNGELVCPQNPANLKEELRRILGVIREESRSFATAAVPTVQAATEDRVFLTNFTPVSSRSNWDGHLNAFLKPLPVKQGKPDTSVLCSSLPPESRSACFLWDAGEEILAQAPTQAQADAGTLKLGAGAGQRRVFYSHVLNSDGTATTSGEWPSSRRLWTHTADGTPAALRYDLWRAMRIPFVPDNPVTGVDQLAQNRANLVVGDTLAIKEATIATVDPDTGEPTTTDITYLLGDTFHSDPIVLGAPPNVAFYVQDAGSDGTACSAGNPGYRCFFEKHRYRRQILLAGSNDGMLHAIDAGIPERQGSGTSQRIVAGSGTGKELFAYIPRQVMPRVKLLAEGDTHRFTVDGDVGAFDVFIDPLYDGVPEENEREWRTVAIAGLREGADPLLGGLDGRSGYFALDVTQPDTLDSDGLPEPTSGYVPSCLGAPLEGGSTVSSDCGPIPFASALWEFTDSLIVPEDDPSTLQTFTLAVLDEDPQIHPVTGQPAPGRGVVDLGESWSTPSLGRIQLCAFGGSECDPTEEDNDVEDRFVAIFGGGMDPLKVNSSGNWLYMVDIETGQAIYKRLLLGSAASEPAAVDLDGDGYLDRIYIGTTLGFLYRVDLTAGDDGNLPALEELVVTTLSETLGIEDIDDADTTVRRVIDSLWEPRIMFHPKETLTAQILAPDPIYHRPSVVFLADRAEYAVAFGTGDREDLWSSTTSIGNFYVVVDSTTRTTVDPLHESDLVPIDADAPPEAAGTNHLAGDGWYMVLEAGERVISDSFAISGVLFFESFQPDIEFTGDGGPNSLCSKTGESRIFTVNATNGNPLTIDDFGDQSRYVVVGTFVTQTFTEQGATKNPPPGGGATADDLTDRLRDIQESLKDLFPPNCKFANYRLDIKTIGADTGVVFVAPVPICIVDKNWKEF